MIGGDADVLVQVEQLDARPVHRRAGGQSGQETELRVPGGGDDVGENLFGIGRRRGGHLVGGGGDVDSHPRSLR